MTISINSSPPISVIHTGIGTLPIAHLNNWNNTAFSQLCLSKSDHELVALMHSPALSLDKQHIAASKWTERQGNQM